MLGAVVLDLDGTLFDHASSAWSGLGEWLDALGVAVTDDVVAAWFADEKRHYPAWSDGSISFAEQRRRRLRDVLPLVDRPVGDDAALDATFAGYLACYERCWRAFDDAAPAIAALRARGLRTAVLTNGTEHQQRAKLERIGLLEGAGPLFTSEALGVAKPDARTFHLVCEVLGLAPERVLHVGDDHALDVVAARAAGLPAVHLDRAGRAPFDDGARIATLADLLHHHDV